MKTIAVRAACAAVLVALGWLTGRAQAPRPEFVLELEAPQGRTSVTCARGCELIGSRDHGNPNAGRMLRYEYACGADRCRATVYGWLKKEQ
jgi:hypothetical protein